jgi:hemerythrin-like domain-containing protein
MKRHRSLHALSQHHHFALMESLFIRRAGEKSGAARTAALKKVAEDFVHFWESGGRIHFREEEEILLPAYASHVPLEEDADVLRMLADHAAIRARIRALSSTRAEDEAILALGRMLYDHVRLEENVIFPRIEKTLTETEMQEMGRLLTWLHPRNACEI